MQTRHHFCVLGGSQRGEGLHHHLLFLALTFMRLRCSWACRMVGLQNVRLGKDGTNQLKSCCLIWHTENWRQFGVKWLALHHSVNQLQRGAKELQSSLYLRRLLCARPELQTLGAEHCSGRFMCASTGAHAALNAPRRRIHLFHSPSSFHTALLQSQASHSHPTTWNSWFGTEGL